MGAAYGARDVSVGKRKLTMGIWDTAGSERYESMTKHYYHKAQGAVVCFDLTDLQSFEKAKFWVNELNQVEENVLIALVGTKADLLEEQQDVVRVPKQAILQYAHSINAKYFETSAKLGRGVEEPFLHLAKEFASSSTNIPQVYDPNLLSLSNNQTQASSSSNCCGK